MRADRLRWAPLILLLSLLLGVTACVSVPTSGPIERVVGQPPGCTNCISVDVAPPQVGDGPRQIVEGYLRATSNYQPAYSIARQYLTENAAGSWTPEAGAQIYSGGLQVSGNRVVLSGNLLGTLDRDRSFKPNNSKLAVDFGLVRQADGQWRINTPPQGLLVAEYAFTSFYQPANLYFVGVGSLVPDPIYLPNLRNQAGFASALIGALLDGPSGWLKPAVTTAIPAGTTLVGDAVTIADRIAEVPLSDAVLQLNGSQRDLLAAQVLYTLSQPPVGIRAIRFTVNSQPFPIPAGDPGSFEVRDTAFADLNPVPFVAGDQLYAMRGRGVEQINAASDEPDGKPVDGPFGEGRVRVESMGVSVSGTDLVAVTNRGTTLVQGTATGGPLRPVLGKGITRLLRPQFSRTGEIWAIGDRAGRQRFWVATGEDLGVEIDSPVLRAGRVTAFKISPDGSRIAVIRRVLGRDELGLLRIGRTGRVTVDGWQPLQLNQSATSNLTRLVDVAWADATNLLVLAGAAGNVPLTPHRIRQDASRITPEGQASNWDAVSVTVSIATQAAIVLGRSRQTWRDGGSEWLPYLKDVDAIAYPG